MDMIKLYVEVQDGIYSAYCNKHDPYITTHLLKEATLDKDTAEYLCRATAEYNETQDLLYRLYND